ncbi:MAG UNVERIFIED_CONTAM: hypothetical protein LVT10_27555 [Anaerolineae bacterium]
MNYVLALAEALRAQSHAWRTAIGQHPRFHGERLASPAEKNKPRGVHH